MTNVLTQLRLDLQAALKAARLNAFLTVPDKATPPMVYVAPGDPYLSFDGANFGGQIARHQIVAVARAGVNTAAAEAIDELALEVLDALSDLDDHLVTEVGQPGQITINGQQHLALAVSVETEIRR